MKILAIKNYSSYALFLGTFFLNGCGGDSNETTYISSPIPNYTPYTHPTKAPNRATTTSPHTSNAIANQALEQIYILCEKPGYDEFHPFCLTHNLRNIRQIIKPYLHKIKNYDSADKIRYTINEIFEKDLKVSHFYLSKGTNYRFSNLPFARKFAINSPSKSYIQSNHVELTINDFSDNFNWFELKRGLDHALAHHKGIIIDLRENPGGLVSNLKKLFSYFFPYNTVISHTITRKHEPHLGTLESWIGDYSKFKMKNLVNTIQANWNSTNSPWEINLLGNSPIHKNIAILINENSASCSEWFTMALKEHYPHRVKIIGKRSSGALLSSCSENISHLGLKIQYPRSEIIGIHGTRVEGVGIEADERVFTQAWAMSVAKDWATR